MAAEDVREVSPIITKGEVSFTKYRDNSVIITIPGMKLFLARGIKSWQIPIDDETGEPYENAFTIKGNEGEEIGLIETSVMVTYGREQGSNVQIETDMDEDFNIEDLKSIMEELGVPKADDNADPVGEPADGGKRRKSRKTKRRRTLRKHK